MKVSDIFFLHKMSLKMKKTHKSYVTEAGTLQIFFQ